MTTVATTPVGSTSDWAGSPLSTLHHIAHQARTIPLEQYPDGPAFVIRMEVPGIDPVRDLTVSVVTGTLTVRGERRHLGPEDADSEFRYGSFARTVALPAGADIDDVTAQCHDGILTVRIGMQPEHRAGARRVQVQVEP